MKRVLSICAVLMLCPRARAQEPVPERKAQPTHYEFDDELVPGDYPSPTEIFTVARTRGKRGSLIQVRQSFVEELAKSIEDL